MTTIDPARLEALGPAEQLLRTLLTHSDHMVHHRPGVVVEDASTPAGVRWFPVTHKDKVVYRLEKKGRRRARVAIGALQRDGRVLGASGALVGRYRAPGLFPEVAAWLYGQVAEVWRLDNDFAARWASWAFAEEHRDLKVALAALMLVQSRCGEAVLEDGEVLFHDDDLRAVGEAMCLLRRRDGRDLNPKLLLRVGELLSLQEVGEINRRLGFGRSARNPTLGRWPKAVRRWLRHREQNPRMLEGLVRAGYRRTVMQLARRVGYKPLNPQFFAILRWKQTQAGDGRRAVALDLAVDDAETWQGLSEAEICRRIVRTRPSWKRVVGLLPAEPGLTRAIVAAAVEAGCVSDADLVILTPTLEDLGLLEIEAIGDRWLRATEAAENTRAANIAQRVRRKDTADKLREAADKALQREVEKELRDLRVYCAVDISGSMSGAIERSKVLLTRFLQGFPLEKLTVAVFNSTAREVPIRHPSAKGVEHAFKGYKAGGGTSHGAAFQQVFSNHPPAAHEDALVIVVGDQQDNPFADAVRRSGVRPVAFGFVEVDNGWSNQVRAVEDTATALGVPCFRLDESTFDDPYAVSRTLRRLIASTPVGARKASTPLVETILNTPLLERPLWAA
ncbi:MAG: VWA domain-containing protein [Alphaproteobacteria bacterium]|nr:VWA domain-containing protein [Alphaproteobacteria bacterium]